MKEKFNYLLDRPFLLFVPFLILFIIWVLINPTDGLYGDEGRYLMFANNLLQGFYSPPGNFNLWNGPGFPIYLLPFVALGLPLITITLANAVLHYLSLVFLYKIITKYTNKNIAFLAVSIFICYIYPYIEMYDILTEILTIFIIVMILFFYQKYFEDFKLKYAVITGLLIGYLVLVKVAFGYVVLVSLGLLLFTQLFLLIRKKDLKIIKSSIMILSFAFLTFLPYLIYTYSLTGRMFFFADSASMSLYCMSTPYPDEYGDWNNLHLIESDTMWRTKYDIERYNNNHSLDFKIINQFHGLDRYDKYLEIAIKNIKEHPLKYIKNIIANIGRLTFGVPYSYENRGIINLIQVLQFSHIYLLILISSILWIFDFRKVPIEINMLMIFVLLYLAESSLVSSYSRMFYIILPIILTWVAIILSKRFTFHTKIINKT